MAPILIDRLLRDERPKSKGQGEASGSGRMWYSTRCRVFVARSLPHETCLTHGSRTHSNVVFPLSQRQSALHAEWRLRTHSDYDAVANFPNPHCTCTVRMMQRIEVTSFTEATDNGGWE